MSCNLYVAGGSCLNVDKNVISVKYNNKRIHSKMRHAWIYLYGVSVQMHLSIIHSQASSNLSNLFAINNLTPFFLLLFADSFKLHLSLFLFTSM